MAAIDLLDLEHGTLGWTATNWQRKLFPAVYRDELLVLHDGIDTHRFVHLTRHTSSVDSRSIAGRIIPPGTRVVSFVARSIDRLRGFDRFLAAANRLLQARSDVVCVVVGEPLVLRGLDVVFHNQDYPAHLMAQEPPFDPDRLWMLGRAIPAIVAEVLAASDLHIAPSRVYPVARSVLEAMAAGCVVLASDTEPHREVIEAGRTGLLVESHDAETLVRQALAVLADPDAYRALGEAAAAAARERYSRDVCLPRLAERFSALAAAEGGRL
jgi:glycosyltransferase involved in cell wall biosynthesis